MHKRLPRARCGTTARAALAPNGMKTCNSELRQSHHHAPQPVPPHPHPPHRRHPTAPPTAPQTSGLRSARAGAQVVAIGDLRVHPPAVLLDGLRKDLGSAGGSAPGICKGGRGGAGAARSPKRRSPAESARIWSRSGQMLSKSGQVWSNSGDVWSASAQSGVATPLGLAECCRSRSYWRRRAHALCRSHARRRSHGRLQAHAVRVHP